MHTIQACVSEIMKNPTILPISGMFVMRSAEMWKGFPPLLLTTTAVAVAAADDNNNNNNNNNRNSSFIPE